jgi:hypothetical protein
VTIGPMPTTKRYASFLAATTMAVLGFLTAAPLAQAAPNTCSQYTFGGDFVVRGDNIGRAVIFAAPGTRLAGEASTIGDDGRAVYGFVAEGGVDGRKINFVISWLEESETRWNFKGTVGDDGLVHNGFMHGPGFMSLWKSTTPLACNDPIIATKPLPDSVVTAPVQVTPRVPLPVFSAP